MIRPDFREIKHAELYNSERVVNFKMNNLYYLSHGGPGSGRYPWGSGDRPYQRLESSRRKTGISKYISERRAATELKKAQDKEKRSMDKDRVLREGSASDVAKYKGELTRQELQDVYNRLNLEKKISEMSSTEIIDSQKIISTVLANVKTTAEWVAEGAAAYNILASVYNAMISDESKRLPVLKITK